MGIIKITLHVLFYLAWGFVSYFFSCFILQIKKYVYFNLQISIPCGILSLFFFNFLLYQKWLQIRYKETTFNYNSKNNLFLCYINITFNVCLTSGLAFAFTSCLSLFRRTIAAAAASRSRRSRCCSSIARCSAAMRCCCSSWNTPFAAYYIDNCV